MIVNQFIWFSPLPRPCRIQLPGLWRKLDFDNIESWTDRKISRVSVVSRCHTHRELGTEEDWKSWRGRGVFAVKYSTEIGKFDEKLTSLSTACLRMHACVWCLFAHSGTFELYFCGFPTDYLQKISKWYFVFQLCSFISSPSHQSKKMFGCFLFCSLW